VTAVHRKTAAHQVTAVHRVTAVYHVTAVHRMTIVHRVTTVHRVMEGSMMKLLNKAVGMLVSVLGGMLARAMFKKIWKTATGEEDAPRPTDARRGWGEILLAAALQGALFAVVQAALDRGTAEGTSKLTGVWPGNDGADQSGDNAREQSEEGRPD
jgi:hypothetical protein